MKIAQIIWRSTIGGLENHVLMLSDSLRQKGYDAEVVVMRESGPLTDVCREKSIPCTGPFLNNGFDLAGALRFRRFMSTKKFDMIHLHTRNFLTSFALTRIRDGRIVFTEHGGELLETRPVKRRLFYRLFGAKFAYVIASSHYISEMLTTRCLLPGEKIKIVHNGVDVDRFAVTAIGKDGIREHLDIPRENKVVGLLARLIRRKGIDLFIDAAKRISEAQDNITFLIVGDGPDRPVFEKIAQEAENKTDIRFTGWERDVARVLPAFDLFLFTSRWEPFGIVLLEAMAAGVPIAGFDVPGANEVILEGKTALLVPPFDTEKLAHEAVKILSNDSLCERLKREGERRVRAHFDQEKNSLSILDIYEKLTAET